ncbi:alpha/beta-hydrolase [Aspergillus aculeatinus CBS 121060]|uniref:Alpha/beta-hydrolase n=1 Tax=Aspergillus aculeatinus CBS 121060 TaxID=1448322 RepID=A0ACD1HPD7_9EURO|nr:alpha/beta-hydrolase [Aspergillus aculeatinus CBS 121060]RAH75331.1 alpha/beta-hydrolase [Aspergillus aculeatinus CBS 121060]
MTNFKINLLFGVVAVAIHHHLLERANIPILSASIFPPTVTDFTRNIRYIGSRTPGVEHFQNVFYAEEPTGQRRFAPPVPVSPPKGSIIDASKPGAWCPQGVGDILPFTSQVNNISENCLSLRIARPSGVQRDAKLPVAVWIHGGGHALGSASDILYTPDGLVRAAAAAGKPLIYVGINYRLGIFGFATSKAMIETKQTNAGLRDQRVALQWVQDHIEVFGGDPDRVTAIGQSVGASDIGLHLTSFNGSRNVPFQQAMMMSGAPGVNFNSDPVFVANNTVAIARQVGCAKNEDGQSIETLECLRAVPADLLINVTVNEARKARPPFGEGYFYPTIDNDYLNGRPSQLMRTGKFVKNIPIVASWVTNDGAWYASPQTSTDEDVLGSFGLWLHGFSRSTKEKLLQLYPVEDFNHMVRQNYDGGISPQYYRAAQMSRDIWFTCPVLDFSWQYAQTGGLNASRIWLYEHNATRFTPVFEAMGVPMWRVAHLSDIPYVFNNPHLEGGADNSLDQLALSETVSKAIVGFVHEGRPGGEGAGMQKWSSAYPTMRDGQRSSESASRLSIQVIGGPLGLSEVAIDRDGDVGVMTAAQQALAWEKLFGRCDFINSPQMRDEAGV